MKTALDLAQGFVEGATACDFADMPDDVKELLITAASAVLTVISPETIVISEREQ